MPPLPSVANVLRADLLWNDGSDTDVSTRMFFRYSGGPPDPTDAVALAADIWAPASSMNDLWSTNTDLTGVRVTDLASATGGQGEHAQSSTGTRVGSELAGGTCLVVGYVVQRRYRGGKPRSYFPWFTSADLTTRQTWNTTDLTSVDSALATFFAAVIGLTSGTTTITDHVNVSWYEGNKVVTNPITGRARNVPQLRPDGPKVDVISSFAARPTPGSQRRRNR